MASDILRCGFTKATEGIRGGACDEREYVGRALIKTAVSRRSDEVGHLL